MCLAVVAPPGATHDRQGKPSATPVRAPWLVSVVVQLSWCHRGCGVSLRSRDGFPRVTIRRCGIGNFTSRRVGFTSRVLVAAS
jgi:hypothetical protein